MSLILLKPGLSHRKGTIGLILNAAPSGLLDKKAVLYTNDSVQTAPVQVCVRRGVIEEGNGGPATVVGLPFWQNTKTRIKHIHKPLRDFSEICGATSSKRFNSGRSSSAGEPHNKNALSCRCKHSESPRSS